VIEVTMLCDGLVVRLAGNLVAADACVLREALLRPRPATCRDFIVDAGDVSAIDQEPLRVLAAASGVTGRRMTFSRLSTAMHGAAERFGVGARLSMLGPPGSRAT
jgi:anti-anti-sigma regulatory factor